MSADLSICERIKSYDSCNSYTALSVQIGLGNRQISRIVGQSYSDWSGHKRCDHSNQSLSEDNLKKIKGFLSDINEHLPSFTNVSVRSLSAKASNRVVITDEMRKELKNVIDKVVIGKVLRNYGKMPIAPDDRSIDLPSPPPKKLRTIQQTVQPPIVQQATLIPNPYDYDLSPLIPPDSDPDDYEQSLPHDAEGAIDQEFASNCPDEEKPSPFFQTYNNWEAY